MRTLAVPILLVFGVAMSSFPVVAQDLPTIYLYVNDLTTPGTLLSDEFNALEDLCYQVDSLTSAEIAILVVNTTQPWGIDTFAARTFSANGIGKAGCVNDAPSAEFSAVHASSYKVPGALPYGIDLQIEGGSDGHMLAATQ